MQRGGVPMDKQMVDELVAGLLKIVDKQLVSVILYGSVARGTASCESDVDVALLVKGSLAPETEDALSDFIVDMNLKYDKVFSVIDIDIDNYEKWKAVTPFYKNVKQDGIVLWKVA
jgi:predicted nucleotidyltransferase